MVAYSADKVAMICAVGLAFADVSLFFLDATHFLINSFLL
jgi:hypothetical protein